MTQYPRSLPLMLLLLAACERPQNTNPEAFLRIVPDIVAAAEADAREAAPQGSARGPLLVDPRSFRYWADRELEGTFDSASVAQAIRQPFEPAKPEDAIQCANLQLGPSCAVTQDGVFVRLSMLRVAPHEIRAYTASVVTHNDYIPPAVCERRLELVFTEQQGQWKLAEQNPKRRC